MHARSSQGSRRVAHGFSHGGDLVTLHRRRGPPRSHRRLAAVRLFAVTVMLLVLALGLGVAWMMQGRRASQARVDPYGSGAKGRTPLRTSDPPAGGTDQVAAPQSATDKTGDDPLKITQVERLQRSFNPTAGETVSIRFSLTIPAQVTLDIHGPNREHLAKLLNAKPCPAGLTTVPWDGRDAAGEIVPDEAYFIRIRAIAGESSDLWDPWLESGGERVTAGALRTLPDLRFSYQIPKACRVLVRAALVNGPLLRTVVNWEPRAAGVCVEPWNGMDADGLRSLAGLDRLRIGVMAYALPVKSILAIGDLSQPYRSYYSSWGRHRPHLPALPRTRAADTLISPHWRIPPHLNRDPQLAMTFPGIHQEPPATGNPDPTSSATESKAPQEKLARVVPIERSGSPALFRVDIPDSQEREFLNDQRFEVIIYVDDRRLLEVEQGHVPFTYPWDISELAPGRHVLTVNVASFRNHVGTVSRLVEVK